MLSVARSSRLLCALALAAIPGAAQGWIEPSPPIRPPLLFPRGTRHPAYRDHYSAGGVAPRQRWGDGGITGSQGVSQRARGNRS
jgi:hypothetical protein